MGPRPKMKINTVARTKLGVYSIDILAESPSALAFVMIIMIMLGLDLGSYLRVLSFCNIMIMFCNT